MPGLTQARANQFIDNALGAGAAIVAAVAPIKVRLMTANGTNTTAGTELATSGGYTAGGASLTFGAASGGQAASSAAYTVTNMPAATIVGVELWDSAVTAVRQWLGALTASKSTNAGDTFTIATGALTASLV